ncbi:MAG: dipeptidase [Planctomycetaceae bacterium]
MHRRYFLQSSAGASSFLPAAFQVDRATAAAGTPALASDPADVVQEMTENLPPAMQQARNIALDLLKPSPAQLERGLRLHAESIVFDSYGFSPRAAIDGTTLGSVIEAGGSQQEVEDLQEDMTMTRYVTDALEQREYLDAWRVSGVTCVFQNAGQECQDPLRLLKRLARFTWVTDMLRSDLSKAVVPADIEAAKRDGRRCLYFTGNGIPLTQEWSTPEDELANVRIFFQLGIRMMHLTYQRRNMIGDGCGEPGNAGLSEFGSTAIRELNRQGVIPDCAHSGWRTSLEAARASAKPVVASHSTCAALHPHIRSKPDEVIRAIADTGGYIGICCISSFLRGTGDIRAFLDHLEYAVKTFGAEHVAIGTDTAWSSSNSRAQSALLPKRPRARQPFRSLWPADDFQTTELMTSSLSWINWPVFTVGMVIRGFSDDQIRMILGGNVMRVARETLAG